MINFIFKPRYSFIILTLILVSVFLTLGFWQLSRAKEKTALEQHFQNRARTAPIPIAQLAQQEDILYSRAIITGHYDNAHTLLLDNKIHQHRIGYEVITPFILDSQKTVLINRGWIPAAKTRAELPQIPVENDHKTLVAQVYIPSEKTFILGRLTENQQWPLRIQALQIPAIEKILERPLYPFVLLLPPQDGSSFVRDWQPINMPASKHLGYAAQWFTFAVVLIIIFLVLNLRKKK